MVAEARSAKQKIVARELPTWGCVRAGLNVREVWAAVVGKLLDAIRGHVAAARDVEGVQRGDVVQQLQYAVVRQPRVVTDVKLLARQGYTRV